jgi:hypothetical protein
MRLHRDRDRNHLLGRRHFEIQRPVDFRLEARDVIVADMPAILAQMGGDPIGTSLDRGLRRLHGIGMTTTSRIADGRDVIDVHAKAQMGRRGHRLELVIGGATNVAARRSWGAGKIAEFPT